MTRMLGVDGMEQQKAEWLSHLTEEVVADARGPELDAYVVALEGWRRGLTLRWHTKDSEAFKEIKTWFVDHPGKLFSLSDQEKTHYFFRTRGDKVTNEAVTIGSDKEMTKQALRQANITTPLGKHFGEQTSDQDIVDYAVQSGFPVVIKPTDGSFGRGVITNITSEHELTYQLTYMREKLGYKEILLEQHIPGEEYRVYVVGDKVVAAMNRIPAHVIGDGTNPIRTLIQLKNKERALNPRLVSCPIKVDKELIDLIQNNKNYTLDTIPDSGETVYLREISNTSTGGDPVSVTDNLPMEVKDTAVRALKAIPGLTHGAVDLIVDERKGIKAATTIIELNPTAQIGGLLFPVAGKAADVPAAIIDYYFPKTKEVTTDKSKLYFDFMDVLHPLVTRSAKVSTVTPYPIGKLYAKKYTVVGDVQQIGYHRGLRKEAFERYLSGLVLRLEDGNIDVVVAGTDQEMIDDFKHAFWEDPERSEVLEVHESSWDGPIKVGFEVRADLKTQIKEFQQLRQEIEITEFELKKAEKQYKRFHRSLSWRMTAPLRALGHVYKTIKGKSQ